MRSISERTLAVAILSLALLVQAAALWPEISVSRFDLNDNVFHLGLIERIVKTVESGGNPLDTWSPEWASGFPVLRSYQPFAHLVVAAVYFALGKTVSVMTVFVWVRFLSVLLLPLSFFACARFLRLPPLTAAAAAALSPLVSTNFLFGVEYGSFTWSGSGLFSQAVATHFLLLAIGLGFTAMREGRRMMAAGILAGLACISHLVYGYMAALSLVMAALIPDAVGRAVRIRRTIAIGAAAFAVAAFQLVPLFSDSTLINHSRWEPVWKWDSYGAGWALSQLFTGELLDHGRLPVLSLLAISGAAWLWFHRRGRETGAGVFLSCGALLWILLLFGRPFWGSLLNALAISEDMHLHRVIAGAQVFLLLLSAVALAELWRFAALRWRVMAAIAVTAVLFYPMVRERARFLSNNEAYGTANLRAQAAARPEIEAMLAEVRRQGGPAYAGLAADWGGKFKVGEVQVYGILSAAGIPEVGFLYHSMSLTSELMPRFDERVAEHYRLFGIRSVVAPLEWTPPPFLASRGTFGRFKVYEAPGQGYFDLVEAPAAVRTTRRNFYDINDRWLHSDWLAKRMHLLLDWRGNAPPKVSRIAPDTALPAISGGGTGECLNQGLGDGVYRAECDVVRPAYALLKMTWHPNWKVYVDGVQEPTFMLSPGFAGVPLGVGRHTVEFRYEPGPLKPLLAIAGWLVLLGVRLRDRLAMPSTTRMAAALGWAGRAVQARSKAALTAAGLIGLAAPVFLPLMTTTVIAGHDAFEYFPRIVEVHQNLLHGILLPRWAPDLGHGFGQPLFVFRPPLFYWIAELFHLAGPDVVTAVNLAAVFFVLVAAFSTFRLGRLYFGDAGGWIAAAAYVYAPYFAVEIYVRSALEEFAAISLFPLLLYGFGVFARSGARRPLVVSVVAYAAMLFCHFPASLLFTPVLVGFIALTALVARSWRVLAVQAGALAVGLALGAASWLPALAETKYVSMQRLLGGALGYEKHFLETSQLFSTMWGYGYSLPGPNDGMSFSLGWSHIVVAILAFLLIGSLRPRVADMRLLSFFAAVCAVLCLLTLSGAEPIWRHLPLVGYVGYPWRMLGPAALCLAMLAGSLARPMRILSQSRRNLALTAILALLIVPNLSHLRAGTMTEVDLAFWTPRQMAASGLETTTAGEVTPRWMPASPPVNATSPAVLHGNAQLREDRQTPFSWTGEVNGTTNAVVRLPRAWFPGWTVRLDGSPIDGEPSPDTGLIQFHAPAGRHAIDVEWGRSPARLLGESISVAAIAVLAFVTIRRERVRSPAGREEVARRAAAAAAG